MNASMIGLDISKSVFQLHGENAAEEVVVQKRLRRGQVESFFAKLPAALIGIEACGSAHHWGRTLRALGHEVRLIPAAYVKPFVKRNKNDARDAAAICVALGRPDMRFVRIKSVEQQASRGLERSRDLLMKQHTQLTNSIRSHMAEFGIVTAQGRRGFAELAELLETGDARIPASLRPALQMLLAHTRALRESVQELEDRIVAVAKQDQAMRRLATIPGVGALIAHAMVAAVGDGKQFACARDFAAWCGLTPKEASSAGKRRTNGLSRMGDIRLRKLFALGAATIMRNARSRSDTATAWQRGILARRPMKVAVLAQAAKTARIAWAILVSGETYQPQRPASRSLATAP